MDQFQIGLLDDTIPKEYVVPTLSTDAFFGSCPSMFGDDPQHVVNLDQIMMNGRLLENELIVPFAMPNPIFGNSTGVCPSLEENAGDLNFNILLEPEYFSECVQYSRVLNKLFTNINGFNVKVQFVKVPSLDLYVRALLVFADQGCFEEPVLPCCFHEQKARHKHFIVSADETASNHYDSSSGRYSVVTPVGDTQNILKYRFICKTACFTGINKRDTILVFTLEDSSGNVFGRKLMNIKITGDPSKTMLKNESKNLQEVPTSCENETNVTSPETGGLGDALFYTCSTGTNPSTADFPGSYCFDISIDKKNYSEKLNKIFTDMKSDIQATVKLVRENHSEKLWVRAIMVYASPQYSQEAVTKCLLHQQDSSMLQSELKKHFIMTKHPKAQYDYNSTSERYSVKVPVDESNQDMTCSNVTYYFTCRSSCYSGIKRRQTLIIFTLENCSGYVLGRHIMEVCIAASPKRDRKREEESTKRVNHKGVETKVQKNNTLKAKLMVHENELPLLLEIYKSLLISNSVPVPPKEVAEIIDSVTHNLEYTSSEEHQDD